MKDQGHAPGDDERPLISVIMTFFNTDLNFFAEAIESIEAQTYNRWELVLVDDGSESEVRAFAEKWRERDPDRIRILEHPNHENRGLNASRKLGLSQVRGSLVTLLDADDAWEPAKLDEQVSLMLQHPEVDMLYGNTLYWYSWSDHPLDAAQDFYPDLGVEDGEIMSGGLFVERLIAETIVVPCTCSVVVRTHQARSVGGFDEEVTLYDDQRFYTRIGLECVVMARHRSWDRYRQHSDSLCALSRSSGSILLERRKHEAWLEGFLRERDVRDERIWRALRRRQWLDGTGRGVAPRFRRRIRKHLLRLESLLLPASLKSRLWSRRTFR